MNKPRVAILGVILESNRISPVAGEEDFRSFYWLEGADILTDARAEHPTIAMEAAAFVRTMDATGDWEPVPILLAACHPHGPVDGALMDTFLSRMRAGLEAAGPIDAVYVANHGAMIATDRDDTDGEIIALARDAAGPDGRVVVTLDLHANISDRMVDACDLIVGYRTNPHVDMIERGEEAALSLRMMLAGQAHPKAALIRLPLTPASVALLTATGPYGELIDIGTRRRAELAGQILNVSIFGGFVFSDSDQNGLAIIVTGRNDLTIARALARELAQHTWDERSRYRKTLTPLNQAIQMAQQEDRAPVIFADTGDNPGGGGTGRTTELLSALFYSGAEGVLIGAFCDPQLASDAHSTGLGKSFRADFNARGGLPGDVPFAAEAEVVGLHDGNVVGTGPYLAGRKVALGPSAAIRIGGITAVIISDRWQTADPIFFEMFGLDIAGARTVAVKSRGHFRAGFLPWFPPEQVYEIDTVGLTSPVLERRQWRYLPRPVYPLDEDASWTPPDGW